MLIGITGSIACGKSVLIEHLRERELDVLNCDEISHDVIKKGRAAYYEIVHHFSPEILGKRKEIDRSKLAKIVFNDESKKTFLENLIFPRVKRDLQHKSKKKIWFVETPLLYESGIENLFEKVICVSTKQDIQIQRLMKRNSITEEEAINLINNQMPLELKEKKADFVVYNNLDIKKFLDEADIIVNKLLKQYAVLKRGRYEI